MEASRHRSPTPQYPEPSEKSENKTEKQSVRKDWQELRVLNENEISLESDPERAVRVHSVRRRLLVLELPPSDGYEEPEGEGALPMIDLVSGQVRSGFVGERAAVLVSPSRKFPSERVRVRASGFPARSGIRVGDAERDQ